MYKKLPLFSQTITHRNPELEKLVLEVSSDSLENYVRTLAAFTSRHTLNTDAENGMPAAQNYVLKKFNEFAKQSGGRMTAEIEKFTIPADARRILKDSQAANVIATLKGTNPNDDRIFVISVIWIQEIKM